MRLFLLALYLISASLLPATAAVEAQGALHTGNAVGTSDQTPVNPLLGDTRRPDAGRLICLVLVVGAGIFYLAHRRKS